MCDYLPCVTLFALRSLPGDEPEAGELKPGSVAGFVHFRYESVHDTLQTIIYHVHIVPAARRKGLGKFAVMLCEMLARKAGMGGALLNIDRSNAAAQGFFAGALLARPAGSTVLPPLAASSKLAARHSVDPPRHPLRSIWSNLASDPIQDDVAVSHFVNGL